MKTKTDKLNNMSTEAVEKATGKSWAQWLKALDAAGCKKMSHKEIVAVVRGKFKIGPWWQQMVTVGYEQARGMRVKHQTTRGFSFNINRTLPVSAERVFKAWTQPARVKQWLDAKMFRITTSTPARSVRMKWNSDGTRVAVTLSPKGEKKTQLSIEHSKFASSAAMEKMRKFWREKIERLQEVLEA